VTAVNASGESKGSEEFSITVEQWESGWLGWLEVISKQHSNFQILRCRLPQSFNKQCYLEWNPWYPTNRQKLSIQGTSDIINPIPQGRVAGIICY